MKIIVRVLLLLAMLYGIAIPSIAQKPLKAIRSALKNKKPSDALKLVEKHASDSTLADKAQLFFYGFEASKRLNDEENEKLYLQQRQDTTAFFNTLYNVFKYALLADSAALSKSKKGSADKFRKTYVQQLNHAYPNLVAASRYFITKKKWVEATQFSRMGIEAQQSPVFHQHPANVSPLQLSQFAERYVQANFMLQRFEEAIRYDSLALLDTINLEATYELLVQASEHLKDSLYHGYLQKGLHLFPKNKFFFTLLSDYYLSKDQADSVLKITHCLQSADSLNAVLYEYQAKAYFHQKKYVECIKAAQQFQALDTASVSADYYIGQSYFSLAQAVDMPSSINAPGYQRAYKQQQKYYAKARPYMEHYRKKAPHDAEVWMPTLYEIYLKLNLGKEFEEITKQIQKQ